MENAAVFFISINLFVLAISDDTTEIKNEFNKRLYVQGNNCSKGFVIMDTDLCMFCFCVNPGVMMCRDGQCSNEATELPGAIVQLKRGKYKKRNKKSKKSKKGKKSKKSKKSKKGKKSKKDKKRRKNRKKKEEEEYRKNQVYYYDTNDCKHGMTITLDNCLVCECKKGSLVDCSKIRPCFSPVMSLLDQLSITRNQPSNFSPFTDFVLQPDDVYFSFELEFV